MAQSLGEIAEMKYIASVNSVEFIIEIDHEDQITLDGETTWVLSWPASPWWRAVTILIVICVPVAFVTFIQYVKVALRKKNASDRTMSSSVSTEEGNK